MEFVGRGEHTLTGLRNRDVRRHLRAERSMFPGMHRRRSGQVSRPPGMLRAHGLSRKMPRTRWCRAIALGRELIAAILAGREARVEKLDSAS